MIDEGRKKMFDKREDAAKRYSTLGGNMHCVCVPRASQDCPDLSRIGDTEDRQSNFSPMQEDNTLN